MKKMSVFLVFFFQIIYSQKNDQDDFTKIPEVFDTYENLYPFIQPLAEYDYWKIFQNIEDPEKNVLYESQIPEPMTILEPLSAKGFFQKCTGDKCYHYIIACHNGRVTYIVTESDLIEFMGELNNIAEAVLFANAHGFQIDSSHKEASSFRSDAHRFYLKVFKQKKCSKVKEAFLLTINKKSKEFFAESLGIYTKDKQCD